MTLGRRVWEGELDRRLPSRADRKQRNEACPSHGSTDARRAGPVNALLVAMRRGHPLPILDCCQVWAKRSGDLIGPNPTDPRLGRSSAATLGCWRTGIGAVLRPAQFDPRSRHLFIPRCRHACSRILKTAF
jgi:hypothetical protein